MARITKHKNPCDFDWKQILQEESMATMREMVDSTIEQVATYPTRTAWLDSKKQSQIDLPFPGSLMDHLFYVYLVKTGQSNRYDPHLLRGRGWAIAIEFFNLPIQLAEFGCIDAPHLPKLPDQIYEQLISKKFSMGPWHRRSRSLKEEDIPRAEECRVSWEEKEWVLTGVHIGSYEGLQEIRWIRLSQSRCFDFSR